MKSNEVGGYNGACFFTLAKYGHYGGSPTHSKTWRYSTSSGSSFHHQISFVRLCDLAESIFCDEDSSPTVYLWPTIALFDYTGFSPLRPSWRSASQTRFWNFGHWYGKDWEFICANCLIITDMWYLQAFMNFFFTVLCQVKLRKALATGWLTTVLIAAITLVSAFNFVTRPASPTCHATTSSTSTWILIIGPRTVFFSQADQ